MKCFVGIGTNLGDRRLNLERAAGLLGADPAVESLRPSPVFEAPALVPKGAPADWNRPFLNAVLELEWRGTAADLLSLMKHIERQVGREPAARWAPRILDLDLLTFGSERFSTPEISVPHPEISKRAFVLAPFSHLAPSLRLPGETQTILQKARAPEIAPLPLWMGIFNLTPDSFSDGGELGGENALRDRLTRWESENVAIVDLGAESTRPRATPLTPEQEWSRLQPALAVVGSHFRERHFRPWVSVDTYRASTAARALEAGADIINDVSGLSDPELLDVLRSSNCQYVLMHSLSVPADGEKTLAEDVDPVAEIKTWAERKLERLSDAGIALDRVIFDPGIGFGKNARQSLELVKRIDEFFTLPVRLLAGHSRKSFLQASPEIHAPADARDREIETLGVSLTLADRGVPIIRVHRPDWHARLLRSSREARACR